MSREVFENPGHDFRGGTVNYRGVSTQLLPVGFGEKSKRHIFFYTRQNLFRYVLLGEEGADRCSSSDGSLSRVDAGNQKDDSIAPLNSNNGSESSRVAIEEVAVACAEGTNNGGFCSPCKRVNVLCCMSICN